MSSLPLGALAMPDIEALPSQPFGPLHLVPLARARAVEGLSLAVMRGDALDDGVALAPHGVVTGFEGASPRVAYGTQVLNVRGGVTRDVRAPPLTYGLARRDATSRVRMLPLGLALEGLLLACFDARPEAWTRRSQQRTLARSVRAERSLEAVVESALRTFERDARQCGLLLYAADTLLAAYVAPSPAVYAALHRALVGDLLGGALQYYLTQHDAAPRPFTLTLPGAAIRTFADLRLALARSRAPWPAAAAALRDGIAPSPLTVRASTKVQQFTLRRFTTSLALGQGNGLGEVVHRNDHALAWLSYLRLSDAQTRRAYLVSEFAAAGWSVRTLAARRTRGAGVADLEKQLRGAGLEHLLTVMGPGAGRP